MGITHQRRGITPSLFTCRAQPGAVHGGMDYTAVAMAVTRLELMAHSSPDLPRLMHRVRTQCAT